MSAVLHETVNLDDRDPDQSGLSLNDLMAELNEGGFGNEDVDYWAEDADDDDDSDLWKEAGPKWDKVKNFGKEILRHGENIGKSVVEVSTGRPQFYNPGKRNIDESSKEETSSDKRKHAPGTNPEAHPAPETHPEDDGESKYKQRKKEIGSKEILAGKKLFFDYAHRAVTNLDLEEGKAIKSLDAAIRIASAFRDGAVPDSQEAELGKVVVTQLAELSALVRTLNKGIINTEHTLQKYSKNPSPLDNRSLIF